MIFVFDLDDTLYPEIDYVRSGASFVVGRLGELGLVDGSAWSFVEKHLSDDWIGILRETYRLPCSKESLLWIYRNHEPRIALPPNSRDVLCELASRGHSIIILTDGRSISQRLKLNSLGLQSFWALISEEYKSEKPSPLRFEAVMARYPDEQYIYVGDNPEKDFVAANELGWESVGIKWKPYFISRYSESDIPCTSLPTHWIDDINNLPECIL